MSRSVSSSGEVSLVGHDDRSAGPAARDNGCNVTFDQPYNSL
jgi:hypothetical protein